MLMSYTSGEFPLDSSVNMPPIYDSYAPPRTVDGQAVNLVLWDTSGKKEYTKFRVSSYPDTDVFLVAFSVVDRSSLASVAREWVPEIEEACGKSRFVLVGCKADLREDPGVLRELEARNESPVSYEEALQASQHVGATTYMECSALTQEGLTPLFDAALHAALQPPPQTPPDNPCSVL
uniref:Uncharacterized protein n=1 Tax=Arcella intermedia TaxID=1963864 RepID=A0A6B2LJL8_9EUKA